MPQVVFPIGISGCGKSRFHKNRLSKYTLIEPDQVRKELTGSVSDQSKNTEVFEEVHRRFIDALKKGEDIYLSETHLNLRFLKDELELMKIHGKGEYTPVFILFEISRYPEVCRERIRSDIESGIDRAATHEVTLQNGDNLLYKMAENYIDLIECDEFNKLVDSAGLYIVGAEVS